MLNKIDQSTGNVTMVSGLILNFLLVLVKIKLFIITLKALTLNNPSHFVAYHL